MLDSSLARWSPLNSSPAALMFLLPRRIRRNTWSTYYPLYPLRRVISLTVCLSFHSTVIEYRISRRVKEQFDAFMSGFSELIPQELINVFDERELEVCCFCPLHNFPSLRADARLAAPYRWNVRD